MVEPRTYAPPPIVDRTAPICDVEQVEVDNMAIGGGEVFISRARASCAMSLYAILARIASRGAQMRQIAASTWSGSCAGAVMRFLRPGFVVRQLPPDGACPWSTLFLPATHRVLPPPGNNAHWQETSQPTLQHAPPPHGELLLGQCQRCQFCSASR